MEDRYLNPTQKEAASWVRKLTSAYPNEDLFVADKTYSICDDEGKVVDLTPTFSIVKATPLSETSSQPQKSNNKYFVIANTVEGKGAYGEVRPIIGRWHINTSGADFKPKSNRMIKTCQMEWEPDYSNSHYSSSESDSSPMGSSTFYDISSGEASHEFSLLSSVPYFNIKYKLVESHHSYTTIMAKVGFIGLEQWINEWRNNPDMMTTNQALALAISLIDIINEFHQQYRMIHADIKPANTRLELKRGLLKPKLVDLGLSFKMSEPVEGQRGHYGYMDPYNVNNENETVDVISDQYSILISIMELFGFDPESIPSYYSADKYYPDLDYSTLFSECSDLANDHQDKLIGTLKDATEPHRVYRKSLQDVRNCFKSVLIDRLRHCKVNDSELRAHKYSMDYQLDSIDGFELFRQDEVYRDHLALIALDELVSFGKLDELLSMPLKDIIKDYLDNSHACSDILLTVQKEILHVIESVNKNRDLPETLISFYEETLSLSRKPMPLASHQLIDLTNRMLSIREIQACNRKEDAPKEKDASILGLANLSIFPVKYDHGLLQGKQQTNNNHVQLTG